MLKFNLAKKGEKALPPTPSESSGGGPQGTEKEKGRGQDTERGRKE